MTTNTTNPRRLAIIGTGRIAHAHAEAIARNPRAELVAVFDPDASRAHSFTEEHGAQVVSTALEELVGAHDLHGVVICSPTQVHAEQGVQVLQAGVPILVEKPFAADGESARRMVQTGARKRLTVMSAQLLRFMPMMTLTRELISAGELGRPIQAIERRLVYRNENYPWWQDLPSFLISHWGSHSLDAITHLTSGTVDSVYSAGVSTMSDFGVIDDFSLIARYREGFRFTSTMSFASRATIHDIILIGEEATVEFDGYHSVRVNGELRLELPEEEMQARAFDAQLAEFLACLEEDGTGVSAGSTVLHTLSALQAAERAVGTGLVEPVEID